MTEVQKKAQEAFEKFLENLCDHIRIAGGWGEEKNIRRMPFEELWTMLYPNDIVIGFSNNRMVDKYRLSRNIRGLSE